MRPVGTNETGRDHGYTVAKGDGAKRVPWKPLEGKDEREEERSGGWGKDRAEEGGRRKEPISQKQSQDGQREEKKREEEEKTPKWPKEEWPMGRWPKRAAKGNVEDDVGMDRWKGSAKCGTESWNGAGEMRWKTTLETNVGIEVGNQRWNQTLEWRVGKPTLEPNVGMKMLKNGMEDVNIGELEEKFGTNSLYFKGQ